MQCCFANAHLSIAQDGILPNQQPSLKGPNLLLLQAAILHAITVKKVMPFSSLSRTAPSLSKLPYQHKKL